MFLNFLYKIIGLSLFSFLVPPSKIKQIEKEVSEAMMKSLRYCDVDSASARQPLCQYRAATIHHRLASMYHSCLRNQVPPSRRSVRPRPLPLFWVLFLSVYVLDAVYSISY